MNKRHILPPKISAKQFFNKSLCSVKNNQCSNQGQFLFIISSDKSKHLITTTIIDEYHIIRTLLKFSQELFSHAPLVNGGDIGTNGFRTRYSSASYDFHPQPITCFKVIWQKSIYRYSNCKPLKNTIFIIS